MSAEDTTNDDEFYNDDAPPADLAAGGDVAANSDADAKWVQEALAALDRAGGDEEYVTIPGTDGMLEMKVIKKGSGAADGAAKRPQSGDHIVCHYTGTLTTGVVFDSSRTRGPFEFDLAKSVGGRDASVIKAWDMAVRLMARGDQVQIRAKPEICYGPRETGSIPANSTLIFDIELLEFGKKPVDVARDGTVLKRIISDGKGYKLPRYESKFALTNVVLYRGANMDVGAVCATAAKIEAVLGDVDLPPGFDFALESMKEGEEAAITFSASDLAGAERFVNGISDPAADAAAAAAFAAGKGRSEVFTLRCTMGPFDVVQTWGGTAESKFESALQRKEQGNRWVGEGLFARAVRKYERAIDFVGDPAYDAAWSDVAEDGRNEARALRAVCMSNMALCFLKLHNYKDALAKADEALKSDATNAKARFRRCQALHALGEWTAAIAELQKLPQSDAAVAAELATLLAKKKADDERQKKVFSKMFA
jgi:FK506-binding protein 4/5